MNIKEGMTLLFFLNGWRIDWNAVLNMKSKEIRWKWEVLYSTHHLAYTVYYTKDPISDLLKCFFKFNLKPNFESSFSFTSDEKSTIK